MQIRLSPDGLSPFIGRLDQDLLDGVAAVVAEAPARLSWGPHGGLEAELDWGEGKLTLLVRVADDESGGWRAGPLRLTVRRGRADPLSQAGGRALLRRLVDRLATPSDDLDEAGQRLADAMSARRAFPLVSFGDWMFRRVEQTVGGAAGFLRLGFRCNQDCRFCPQGRSWGGPPDDRFMGWLEELGAMGLRDLTLTGGEPTIHPRFLDLVERASQVHGMRVMVQTNAVRFANPRFRARARAAGLHAVFTSLHSADATTSDHLTRAPGTWTRTVAGVEASLADGFRTHVNCCIERANVDQLEAHARFIVDRFVTPFPDNPLRSVDYSQPGGYFDRDYMADQMAPLSSIGPSVVAAVQVLRRAGVHTTVTGTCGMPLCTFRQAPSLVAGMVAEARDQRGMAGRTFGEACGGCAARPVCNGVRRGYLAIHGEGDLVPFTTAETDELGGLMRALEGSLAGLE